MSAKQSAEWRTIEQLPVQVANVVREFRRAMAVLHARSDVPEQAKFDHAAALKQEAKKRLKALSEGAEGAYNGLIGLLDNAIDPPPANETQALLREMRGQRAWPTMRAFIDHQLANADGDPVKFIRSEIRRMALSREADALRVVEEMLPLHLRATGNVQYIGPLTEIIRDARQVTYTPNQRQAFEDHNEVQARWKRVTTAAGYADHALDLDITEEFPLPDADGKVFMIEPADRVELEDRLAQPLPTLGGSSGGGGRPLSPRERARSGVEAFYEKAGIDLPAPGSST